MSALKRPEDIKTVIVIGAGVMGEGIVQSFAEAGLKVHIIDINSEALARCKTQIAANLELSAEHDMLSEPIAAILGRIKTSKTDALPDLLHDCEMVVETAPEVLDIKQSIFKDLDSAPDHVLLASNTSSFTVSQLTEGMNTAHRVIGLHYFNPAHIIPAVEVHIGEASTSEAIDLTMAFMERVGKSPVLVRKEIPGFIINRLTGALSREVDHLLDQGVVTPEDLDKALRSSLGFRLAQVGIMEARDFIGLDTDARVSKNLYPQLSDRSEISKLSQQRVEEGHYGVKTGRGVFDYTGRTRSELLRERDIRLLEQRRAFLATKDVDQA